MLEKRIIGTDDSLPALTRYVYSNHLQSASLELDEGANIISYEEYHPYGTTAFQAKSATINAVAKRYRYTGKERDEESGLYYHGARYYIPWLARWTAIDPMESKYAGMSPYNYSFNNPIVWNDLNGADPGEDQAGASQALQQTPRYKSGVIPYDYAEWKGFDPPTGIGGSSKNDFEVGNYNVRPYYKTDGNGKAIGNPLYYTASIQVNLMDDFDSNGNRSVIKNGIRTDFLIMPWGLSDFKKHNDIYEFEAFSYNINGLGNFQSRHLDKIDLLAIDGQQWAAVKEMNKQAVKSPMFWAGLGLNVANLRGGGSINSNPKALSRKIKELEAGHPGTTAELRVAEAYKNSGRKVTLIDDKAPDAVSKGATYDMYVEGFGKVDVKRLSGLGRNAADQVNKGVSQVGSGGTVVIVRPTGAKATLQEYQRFFNNFTPKIPNVRITVINESSLPKFKR